ncbi:MAG: hypothetical protein SVG88_05280 [Halobacteriales archaeon]|nr:hypothetical protein [Halobacteriales archaeon]
MRTNVARPWSSRLASFRRWLRQLHGLAVGACFWTAVLFPLLYVPLLVAELPARSKLGILLVAVVLDLTALVVSHSYRPGDGPTAEG